MWHCFFYSNDSKSIALFDDTIFNTQPTAVMGPKRRKVHHGVSKGGKVRKVFQSIKKYNNFDRKEGRVI